MTPFVPLLLHPIKLLGRMTTLSSRMVIDSSEEHQLADVSAMMSSELRRHCNKFSFIYIHTLKIFTLRVPTASRTT